jgi:hypothetical protein
MSNHHETGATGHADCDVSAPLLASGLGQAQSTSESPKTVAASLNETQCLRKFFAAFFGFNSNSTGKTSQVLSSLESLPQASELRPRVTARLTHGGMRPQRAEGEALVAVEQQVGDS